MSRIRRCRVCGCTDGRACPGGCYWVDDPEGADLCSVCAERAGYSRRAPSAGPRVKGLRLLLDLAGSTLVELTAERDALIASRSALEDEVKRTRRRERLEAEGRDAHRLGASEAGPKSLSPRDLLAWRGGWYLAAAETKADQARAELVRLQKVVDGLRSDLATSTGKREIEQRRSVFLEGELDEARAENERLERRILEIGDACKQTNARHREETDRLGRANERIGTELLEQTKLSEKLDLAGRTLCDTVNEARAENERLRAETSRLEAELSRKVDGPDAEGRIRNLRSVLRSLSPTASVTGITFLSDEELCRYARTYVASLVDRANAPRSPGTARPRHAARQVLLAALGKDESEAIELLDLARLVAAEVEDRDRSRRLLVGIFGAAPGKLPLAADLAKQAKERIEELEEQVRDLAGEKADLESSNRRLVDSFKGYQGRIGELEAELRLVSPQVDDGKLLDQVGADLEGRLAFVALEAEIARLRQALDVVEGRSPLALDLAAVLALPEKPTGADRRVAFDKARDLVVASLLRATGLCSPCSGTGFVRHASGASACLPCAGSGLRLPGRPE